MSFAQLRASHLVGLFTHDARLSSSLPPIVGRGVIETALARSQ